MQHFGRYPFIHSSFPFTTVILYLLTLRLVSSKGINCQKSEVQRSIVPIKGVSKVETRQKFDTPLFDVPPLNLVRRVFWLPALFHLHCPPFYLLSLSSSSVLHRFTIPLIIISASRSQSLSLTTTFVSPGAKKVDQFAHFRSFPK